MGAENVTPPEFDPGTVQPVPRRCTDHAIQVHLQKNKLNLTSSLSINGILFHNRYNGYTATTWFSQLGLRI